MFCGNCGQANPDEALFCENCGERLQSVVPEGVDYAESAAPDASVAPDEASVLKTPAEYYEYTPPVMSAVPASGGFSDFITNVWGFIKKYLLWFIIAGATLTLVILLAIFGVFKSGSLKAVEKYIKADFTGNGKAMFELTYDPESLELAIDDREFLDKEDGIELYKETGEEVKEENEYVYGKGLRITRFKHKSTKKYKKNEVKSVNKYLEEEHGYPENYISALHVIRVDYTMKGRDDYSSVKGRDFVAAKIKGKWYINCLPDDLDSKDEIRDAIINY